MTDYPPKSRMQDWQQFQSGQQPPLYPPTPAPPPKQERWPRRHPFLAAICLLLGIALLLYGLGVRVFFFAWFTHGSGATDSSFQSVVLVNSAISDGAGNATSMVTITNNSGVTSDYSITVEADSPDNSITYSSTTVTATDVASGTSDFEEADFTGIPPEGAHVVFTQTSRTAS